MTRLQHHHYELIRDEANTLITNEVRKWGDYERFHVSTAQVRNVIDALFKVAKEWEIPLKEVNDA